VTTGGVFDWISSQFISQNQSILSLNEKDNKEKGRNIINKTTNDSNVAVTVILEEPTKDKLCRGGGGR